MNINEGSDTLLSEVDGGKMSELSALTLFFEPLSYPADENT